MEATSPAISATVKRFVVDAVLERAAEHRGRHTDRGRSSRADEKRRRCRARKRQDDSYNSARNHDEIGKRPCAGPAARPWGRCPEVLDTLIRDGDCVFVKGSFTAKMGLVMEGLQRFSKEP